MDFVFFYKVLILRCEDRLNNAFHFQYYIGIKKIGLLIEFCPASPAGHFYFPKFRQEILDCNLSEVCEEEKAMIVEPLTPVVMMTITVSY